MSTFPPETPLRPAEALRRFYAAEERYVASGGRDFDAVSAAVDPDVLIVVPESLPYGGRWQGREGLRRFLDAFADAWEELSVEDAEVLEAGEDRAIVLLTMRARARWSGRTMTMPLCQVNRFRDGRLCEIRPYYGDTVVVRQTLGCPPGEGADGRGSR